MEMALEIGAGHWVCLIAVTGIACAGRRWRRQARERRWEAARERRIREELEVYAGLDVSISARARLGARVETASVSAVEAARALGKRVCRAVAEKSVFTRVALLLRDAEGRFACVGSVGVDDLTLRAVQAWGGRMLEEERSGRLNSGVAAGSAGGSFSIELGAWNEFDPEVGSWALSGRKERRRRRRGIATPIRAGGGRMAGAIVVCADGAEFDALMQTDEWGRRGKAMGAIESLAGRMAAEIGNEAMAERLVRAEKLAGLGQLAGGVAHALNNPLTAVLGYAELIAESTGDARVREDARTILGEAVKMKETVGRLIEFWRPTTRADEVVDVPAMLEELETACAGKLAERGARLEIKAPARTPAVRGARERLRQVLEHLLNNAAQAIAEFGPLEEDEGAHAIRVTVSYDERMLHLIVSDTGQGFKAPGRVFDPFYTTNGPEAGAGLGLSICYGIVREHGGEISAFNLHPHGAAVVVELPLGVAASSEGADAAGWEDRERAAGRV